MMICGRHSAQLAESSMIAAELTLTTWIPSEQKAKQKKKKR